MVEPKTATESDSREAENTRVSHLTVPGEVSDMSESLRNIGSSGELNFPSNTSSFCKTLLAHALSSVGYS